LQAVVAAKKEVAILDLETSKVVVRSKLREFYPWNIQYIQDAGAITGMFQKFNLSISSFNLFSM
jgi:hypothetical protein